MKHAFTLIELLIVIAIIAILALIAVPNFLEAQMRAKVSRVYADMRSIATAIEAYAVDASALPLGQGYQWNSDCCSSSAFYRSIGLETARAASLARLTTPIAYMTWVPPDPFRLVGSRNLNQGKNSAAAVYVYQTMHPCFGDNHKNVECLRLGYMWALRSAGPQRNEGGSMYSVLLGRYNTNPNATTCVYDATNGTMSSGWIMRSNKGVIARPEH